MSLRSVTTLLVFPASAQLLKEINVLELQFQIERSCRESAEAFAVKVRLLTVGPFRPDFLSSICPFDSFPASFAFPGYTVNFSLLLLLSFCFPLCCFLSFSSALSFLHFTHKRLKREAASYCKIL